MNRTIPFFLGIINTGAAHLEIFLHFKIPMFTNPLTSVFRVSSCTFGFGNGLAWYGLAPSRRSILYSAVSLSLFLVPPSLC